MYNSQEAISSFQPPPLAEFHFAASNLLAYWY